jgi:hypothetical protein
MRVNGSVGKKDSYKVAPNARLPKRAAATKGLKSSYKMIAQLVFSV